mmetsp:Transcript_52015/g.161418  ORF Transcript_52015/g.161418 Transcript_52015/m.161418 type:complete len:357 (+) Transcript_52015:27-1097(+)
MFVHRAPIARCRAICKKCVGGLATGASSQRCRKDRVPWTSFPSATLPEWRCSRALILLIAAPCCLTLVRQLLVSTWPLEESVPSALSEHSVPAALRHLHSGLAAVVETACTAPDGMAADDPEATSEVDGSQGASFSIYHIGSLEATARLRRTLGAAGRQVSHCEPVRGADFSAFRLMWTGTTSVYYHGNLAPWHWIFKRKAFAKEIGCHMAHIAVWERFLRSSRGQWALVLEEDVMFGSDFIRLASQTLASALEKADVESGRAIDMVFVGHCLELCEVPAVQNLSNGTRMVESSHPFCTHAYLLSRRAASYLLGKGYPIRSAVDELISRSVVNGMVRGLTVCPPIAWQAWGPFRNS